MDAPDVVWAVGRFTVQPLLQAVVPLRVYGKERIPKEGGLVLALNHFSWIDPPAFGAASPRVIRYMAKSEAHRVPGLGQLIRGFGAFSVRRGESDRDAVRMMRQVVSEGGALGLFVEGTRQRAGVPGEVRSGASMVALQEEMPVVCAAIEGSQRWRVGNWAPVSIAWGEPMWFDGLSRNARGSREASAEIPREIRRLWEFLRDLHRLGRARSATPPAFPGLSRLRRERLEEHEPVVRD